MRFYNVKVIREKIIIIFINKLFSQCWIFKNIKTIFIFKQPFWIKHLFLISNMTSLRRRKRFNLKWFYLIVINLQIFNKRLYWPL